MGNIEIKLEGEALREATMQAMMGFLTQDVKEKLIAQAIEALMKPGPSSRGVTILEQAFKQGVEDIIRKEVLRLVSEDGDTKTKINDLLHQTASKVLNMDASKMAERMADAFVSSMRRDY